MPNQALLDKLSQLYLHGFIAGLAEQQQSSSYAALSFEERLGLLVERECLRRDNNRLQRALHAAHFPQPASIEELDLSPARGLERSLVLELASAEWVHRHLNAIVLGATGAGKTFLACALGQAACRQGLSVRYERTSRLLQAVRLAQADGSYAKLLDSLARVHLLILDDWLRDPLTVAQARELLEVLDDRYGRTSTLVATQVPVDTWLSQLPDPTLADAILDRLVHNAYRLDLRGESQRKARSPLAMPTT
jgi:DNA replication protein DnaC